MSKSERTAFEQGSIDCCIEFSNEFVELFGCHGVRYVNIRRAKFFGEEAPSVFSQGRVEEMYSKPMERSNNTVLWSDAL